MNFKSSSISKNNPEGGLGSDRLPDPGPGRPSPGRVSKRKGDLLRIGEVAARSGIASSALRFYEDEGLIQSEREGDGSGRYPRAILRRVAFIQAAQRVGLSLDEIRSALDGLPRGRTPTRADWGALAKSWKPRIEKKIEELEALRDDLTGCIGCGCLSLQRCALYNPQDKVASRGPGARLWRASGIEGAGPDQSSDSV